LLAASCRQALAAGDGSPPGHVIQNVAVHLSHSDPAAVWHVVTSRTDLPSFDPKQYPEYQWYLSIYKPSADGREDTSTLAYRSPGDKPQLVASKRWTRTQEDQMTMTPNSSRWAKI
jgi:hypothetical protein